MSPRSLFKLFAFTEAVTWAALILAMVLRGAGVTDAVVRPAGGVHGFVFLAYCAVAVFVWVDQRWKPWVGLLSLVASVIPFATIPFDLVLDRKGLLSRSWRLGRDGDAPVGAVERAHAWVLRNAIVSVAGLAVVVTVVFVALLRIGPPVSG